MCKVTKRSSVTLGNSLDLILLFDGVGVSLTNTLGSGDDFISEDLGHALVGSEAGVSASFTHKVDSLIDSSKWRNIDSLSSNGTTGTNSGGVLSSSSLNDGLE